MAKLEAEARTLKQEVARQQQEVENLRSRIQLVEAKASELDERVGLLQDIDVERRLGDLEERVFVKRRDDTVMRMITDIEQKGQSDSEYMNDLRDQLDLAMARAARTDELMERVGTLQDTIEELRERLDDQEALELQMSAGPPTDVALLPEARAHGAGDDLKRVKGIGPKFEHALKAAGVTTLQQIADWTDSDVRAMAVRIGTSPERIARAGWIDGARRLVAMDSEPPGSLTEAPPPADDEELFADQSVAPAPVPAIDEHPSVAEPTLDDGGDPKPTAAAPEEE